MTRYFATGTGWLDLATGLMVDGTAPPTDPPPTGSDLTFNAQPLALSGATLTMES